jgi:hypothetical protein
MPLRTGFWMIAVISADPPTHYSLFLPLWGVRRRANEPSNRTTKQLEGGGCERYISVRGLLGCGILCLEGGMTDLSRRKSKCIVQFSDAVRERGKLREVVMELTPYGMRVWLKGMRVAFDVSPASVYNLAVMKAVAAQRAEKKAKKGKR